MQVNPDKLIEQLASKLAAAIVQLTAHELAVQELQAENAQLKAEHEQKG